MLANWVKETTATTGTGTITLAGAATGFISFNTAFNDQQLVHYNITDGNNREEGIGIFSASGTTLARTNVLETLVSGVHDNLAPTAISLSGSAEVTCDSSANNILPTTDATVNSGTNDLIFDAFTPITTKSSRSMVANRTWLMPFFVPHPVTLTGLGVEILTLASGAADQELGLFYRDVSDNSFTLIDRTGNVDISSTGATGFISSSFDGGNLFLNPGMYWIAQTCNVSTGSLQGLNALSWYQHPFGGQVDDAPNAYSYASSTYASGMPSTITEAQCVFTGGGLHPLVYGVKA